MGTAVEPIGHVRTDVVDIPHYWDISEAEGVLVLKKEYEDGLKGLSPGQKIHVIFQFHRSPAFRREHVLQVPRKRDEPMGVFAISSPIRPNPLGLSVVRILSIEGRRVRVVGIDMVDGTPILDIKPCVGLK